MAENEGRPRKRGKALKLFLLIVAILLVPLVLDQADVDRETVRQWGRVAAGLAVLMFVYGLFAKLMKVLAFVVLALIALTLLVSEDQVKAPRLKAMFGDAPASNGTGK